MFAYRVGAAFGLKKTKHFHELPYILVHLDKPGIARQILNEFDSRDEAEHHSLSVHFCSSVKPSLRQHVEAIAPDGSNLSKELQVELTFLEKMPLDETPAEAIHKDSSHVIKKFCAGSQAFTFATVRLQQNLTKAESALESDFALAWHSWKSILQQPRLGVGLKHIKMQRPVKLTKNEFVRKVYRLDQYALEPWETLDPREKEKKKSNTMFNRQVTW